MKELKESRKEVLFNRVKRIVFRQKGALLLIPPLLLFISLGHSLYLLSLGPILKTFFSPQKDSTSVTLGSFLPEISKDWLPDFLVMTEFQTKHLLIWLPCILIGSSLLKNLSTYLYQVILNSLSIYSARLLRQDLFSGLLEKSYREFLFKKPANWMSLIMNDIHFLQEKIRALLSHSMKDLIVVSSSFILTWFFFGNFFLPTLTGLIFFFLFLRKFSQKIAFFTSSFQKSLSEIAHQTLDVRRRYYSIKSSSSEEKEERILEKKSFSYYESTLKSNLLKKSIPPLLESFGFLLLAALLYYSKTKTSGSEGENLLFITGFTIIATTIRPLKSLGEQIGLLGEIKGTLKEIIPHLSKNSAPGKKCIKEKKAPLKKIEIEELKFSFSKEWELRLPKTKLEEGKSYLIQGKNGSGKSTLLRVLAGILEAKEWKASLSQRDFSKNSLFFPQKNYLFNGTLKEIIHYGVKQEPHFNEKKIWEALERVGMKRTIEVLPKRLETKILGLSENLSGGQIQRLILSKIFLSHEKIILLDESLCQVDEKNRSFLLKEIFSYGKRNKKIIIAVDHNVQNQDYYDYLIQTEKKENLKEWFLIQNLKKSKNIGL